MHHTVKQSVKQESFSAKLPGVSKSNTILSLLSFLSLVLMLLTTQFQSNSHLLNSFWCKNIITMNYDGVLTKFWRIVLVQPLIVLCKITLLRDPKLDGVVLSFDEDETQGAEECHHQ